MEGLNPTLKLIWQVKKAVEKGSSVRSGIKNYLEIETDPWRQSLIHWQIQLDQGGSVNSFIQCQKSPYRKQLLLILEKGLKGEAILPILTQLEKETQEKVEMDLEAHIARLPYLLLLPLCLFLFPACLILMLGPFILQLMQSF
jgi:hypothetical protein